MTVWSRSNQPKPRPELKPGQKATRNGQPAWQDAPERLRQSQVTSR
jgi:hypothetical protein